MVFRFFKRVFNDFGTLFQRDHMAMKSVSLPTHTDPFGSLLQYGQSIVKIFSLFEWIRQYPEYLHFIITFVSEGTHIPVLKYSLIS